MKRFEYQALDASGNNVRGASVAADAEAALAELTARGFTRVELKEIQLAPLSASDAMELASYLAEFAKAGVPLTGRLESLALDAKSPALQSAYRQISAELAAGRSPEEVLEFLSGSLPEHYRRTLSMALAHGDLSPTLDRLLAHQQRIDEMSRQFRQAIAYPLLLVAMLLVWVLYVSWEILPPLTGVALDDPLGDWGVESGDGTNLHSVMAFVSTWLPRALLGAVAGCLSIVGIAALSGGRAAVSRLFGALPLLGPCWKNRGLADFCGLLGEFIRQQIPLDEALRLTASACRDPLYARSAIQAREEVSRGKSLVRALHVQRVFPATVAQWANWGETHAALPEAMHAAGDLATQRFSLRVQLLHAVLPALVFLSIATAALFLMSAISHVLLSLASLVTNLSTSSTSVDLQIQAFAVVGALGILGVGFIAWISARLVDDSELAEQMIRLSGIVMMTIGWLATAFMIGNFMGIVLALILTAVVWRVASRYRDIQRQSLWSAMTLAARRNAPLAPMALAVADEQGGRSARDARRLAEQLAAGGDLAESVAATSGSLPKVAPLALRVGTDANDLQGALDAASASRDVARPLLSPTFTWLIIFLPIAGLLVGFTQIKIMPSLVAIFDDFDAELPDNTILFMQLIESDAFLWGMMALGLLLVFVWLQWRGFPRPLLPSLATTVRLLEVGPLLRLLALPVRHGRPLTPAIDSMARLHPRGWIRRRLMRVVRDLQRGATWQEGLRKRGLVAKSDLALLTSAERNGNLAWALESLGSSYQRRAEYRLRVFEEFAFPLLIVAAGLFVAGFALAYFKPLVDLILRLV